MIVSRRSILASSIALGALAAAPARAFKARPVKKPNIIFILADDMGYADLSSYGRRDYKTPEIDALATKGMRFTNAYANSPVCSPTRTALITGRYQARLPVGLEEVLRSTTDLGLPPEHATLPSLLRDQGYRTDLIGKWHLGQLPKYGPLQSGYEHFWGLRTGGIDYFTHEGADGKPDLWDDDAPVEKTGYLTDLIGDHAISRIRTHTKDKAPFFLSLHFTAPHWPWEGQKDQAEAQRITSQPSLNSLMHFDGGSLKTYAEMVTRLDFQVGRIMKALKAVGAERDTIVIFTSDNGGERFSDTWPFSGRKGELLEGGIRIPLIVSWPGRIPAGSSSDQVTISADWLPTLVGAAGGQPDPRYPSDGVDLMSTLTARTTQPRTLFWRYRKHGQQACRDGDYKYLRIGGNSFLFNLAEDPLERANLKDRMPEKFAELKRKYEAWDATMLPLNRKAASSGFSGRTSADRYGLGD